MEKNQRLIDAMVNLEEEKTIDIVKDQIKAGKPVETILSDLQNSLVEIGNRFEKEAYFVPELIYASEIMKRGLEFLKPHLKGESGGRKHKVVMGTVYGDVHDIGKDIVVALLGGTGFDVIDLGVNVELGRFVSAVQETGSKLVGLSTLLTMSFDALSNTVKAIRHVDSRREISIMIGGAPTTDFVCERVGADFYGKDAFEGVRIAKRIYGEE